MKLEIGEVFEYEGHNWTITTLVLNKKQQVVVFHALCFNGSFYQQKEFTLTYNEERAA